MAENAYKETHKDYNYYNLDIQNGFRLFYIAYIAKNPNLGFKNVYQYLFHILESKSEKIINNNPDLKKLKMWINFTQLYHLTKF